MPIISGMTWYKREIPEFITFMGIFPTEPLDYPYVSKCLVMPSSWLLVWCTVRVWTYCSLGLQGHACRGLQPAQLQNKWRQSKQLLPWMSRVSSSGWRECSRKWQCRIDYLSAGQEKAYFSCFVSALHIDLSCQKTQISFTLKPMATQYQCFSEIR